MKFCSELIWGSSYINKQIGTAGINGIIGNDHCSRSDQFQVLKLKKGRKIKVFFVVKKDDIEVVAIHISFNIFKVLIGIAMDISNIFILQAGKIY